MSSPGEYHEEFVHELLETLIREADRALYDSKNKGRNSISLRMVDLPGPMTSGES